MNRVVVLDAVGLSAAYDPDIGCGRVDPLDIRRQLPAPARRNDGETRAAGPVRAFSRDGEDIAPHVEHGQHEVAAAGVRGRDNDRARSEVEPGARIERIEIRPHHRPHVGGRKRANVSECVRWPTHGTDLGIEVDQLLARQVHEDQRIKIDVGLLRNRLRFVGVNHRPFLPSMCARLPFHFRAIVAAPLQSPIVSSRNCRRSGSQRIKLASTRP